MSLWKLFKIQSAHFIQQIAHLPPIHNKNSLTSQSRIFYYMIELVQHWNSQVFNHKRNIAAICKALHILWIQNIIAQRTRKNQMKTKLVSINTNPSNKNPKGSIKMQRSIYIKMPIAYKPQSRKVDFLLKNRIANTEIKGNHHCQHFPANNINWPEVTY